MIKLISSDLDGTLLQNGAQSLSHETLNLIEQLHKRDIQFVAASGRQYPNMKRLFKDKSQNIAFICENGALIIYKDKVIAKKTMDKHLGLELINDIYQQEDCEVLISGQNVSYIKPKTDEYAHRIIHIVKNNVKIIQDFREISEDFIKISAYKKNGIETYSDFFLKKWKNTFKCTISDFKWIDFMNRNANKGSSLQMLLDYFNISAEESIAFGDNYNDLEMLSLVKYGYAMENARQEIKSMYQYQTSSVDNIIKEILNSY